MAKRPSSTSGPYHFRHKHRSDLHAIRGPWVVEGPGFRMELDDRTEAALLARKMNEKHHHARDPRPLSRAELKSRASHHPHAWQVWTSADRHEPAYYVRSFSDKGEAERFVKRLRRSHPGVRYELRRKRVEARGLFGESRAKRKSEASFARRMGRS